jgi:callose synthase
MYLILNTAVSPAYSKPCQGGVCDQIWPANFTIDWVRVYQEAGKENIGCSPPEFPTEGWIWAHSNLYGLPWYTALNLITALKFVGLVVLGALGLLLTFRGHCVVAIAAFLSGVLCFTSVSYSVMYPYFESPLWLGIALSITCGVIMGGVCAFSGELVMGLVLGYYAAFIINQSVASLSSPPWGATVLLCTVMCGLLLRTCQRVGRNCGNCGVVIDIIATSFTGSLCIVTACGMFWHPGALFLAHLFRSFPIWGEEASQMPAGSWSCNNKCSSAYFIWLGVTLLGIVSQVWSQRKKWLVAKPKGEIAMVAQSRPGTTSSPRAKKTTESAKRADADASLHNMFDLHNLPKHLSEHAVIVEIAAEIGSFFGFQTSNVYGQSEHFILLLTNTRGSALESLHRDMFSNYIKWCRHLNLVPAVSSPADYRAHSITLPPGPNGSRPGEDHLMYEQIMLLLLIWGEGGNCRHCPEYMVFLFHCMYREYRNGEPTRASNATYPAGFFLDQVITPVFTLLRKYMRSTKGDHKVKKNYDDFNEMFWSPQCLDYSYCDDQTGAKKSVAEAYTTGSKTYCEKRSWFHAIWTFRRIIEWHFLTFHLLTCIAYAQANAWSTGALLHVALSTVLSLVTISILWELLGMWAKDMLVSPLDKGLRSLRIVVKVVWLCCLALFYWQGFTHHDEEQAATGRAFYLWLSLPWVVWYLAFAVLQVVPTFSTWLRTAENSFVRQIAVFLDPMDSLYVGKDLHESESNAFVYQVFWFLLLTWKLYFSFRFEIQPLVQPSAVLYHDHLTNEVSLAVTIILIFIRWLPFVMIYFIDLFVWHAIWVACTGYSVGLSQRIGEVRTFEHIRQRFMELPGAFNSKLISEDSKAARSLRSTTQNLYGGEGNGAGAGSQNGAGADLQTPLLQVSDQNSTTYRRVSYEERGEIRRRKWSMFATTWNEVIQEMRVSDFVSNTEVKLLQFEIHGAGGFRLPLFQLAGALDEAVAVCIDTSREYERTEDVQQKLQIQLKLEERVRDDPLLEEAVTEVWELTLSILTKVLGPLHENSLRQSEAYIHRWTKQNAILAQINAPALRAVSKNLTQFVSTLQGNLKRWKDYPGAERIATVSSDSNLASQSVTPPARASLFKNPSGGMKKAQSTSNLSMLDQASGGGAPDLSAFSLVPAKLLSKATTNAGDGRRAPVGLSAAPLTGTPRPSNVATGLKASGSKEANTMFGQKNGLTRIRESTRNLLNSLKSLVREDAGGLRDEAFTDSITDMLTWIMSQTRGFLWDEGYSSQCLYAAAISPDLLSSLARLKALLTLSRDDAEPKGIEAKRRIPLFVNSLFMDMPRAPSLQETLSWSVLTPFYSEDILYSKADLLRKADFMEVDTLLYLQTLYSTDWENFLERMGPKAPKQNIWSDAKLSEEIRIWASLRGQTLFRTVRGMMYYERALRLVARVESMGELSPEAVDNLVRTKFSYVVAAQVYGAQKKNNDQKAADIEFLLEMFPHLRVAYIDQVRMKYSKDQAFYSVLVKSVTAQDGTKSIEEVYRVRLPGDPIIGEGKPENQNAAVIFTRGKALQTIDMNQDGYLEEALKVRNVLQEFDRGTSSNLPCTIIGLPEHIFTGSVSSLANYMALQELSFVTLGQRVLNWPLRSRLHYGHPDIFNKVFFMTRGGVSKASKGINLSEDIFAGYNNVLRSGSVRFPEYMLCGKGRDVGMQQIFKFEAKLSQGAAEQSLSRDVNRLANRFDFFRLLSFYCGGLGFYMNACMLVWTVSVLTYLQCLMCLLDLERIGMNEINTLSGLQVLMACLGFLTTAPLVATLAVSRGLKSTCRSLWMMIFSGGLLYFMFHIATKCHYFSQTIVAGGAQYRATGRGFVTQHSTFGELYRFYASSHLYLAFELVVALSLFDVYSLNPNKAAVSWTLWFAAASWMVSPFWFNPLAFDLGQVKNDYNCWWKWIFGTGSTADTCWKVWWKEENRYIYGLSPSAKIGVSLKGFLYMLLAFSIRMHSQKERIESSSLFTGALVLVVGGAAGFAWFCMRGLSAPRFGPKKRMLSSVLLLLVVAAVIIGICNFLDSVLLLALALYYVGAALALWMLLCFGVDNRMVQLLYKLHDTFFGSLLLVPIIMLSVLQIPARIQVFVFVVARLLARGITFVVDLPLQTWLLFNNALSQGVVINQILRGRDDNEDADMAQRIKKLEQELAASLARSNSSRSSPLASAGPAAPL